MGERPPLELHLGDVVRLRKPHPCGGEDWTIVRLGADIGLRCLRCDHRILLPRSQLERRIRRFVSRAAPAPDWAPATPDAPGAGAEEAADPGENGAPPSGAGDPGR